MCELLFSDNNFFNHTKELVDKKDPPTITSKRNIKDKFCGDFSKEIPIFEILLVKDNNIILKL